MPGDLLVVVARYFFGCRRRFSSWCPAVEPVAPTLHLVVFVGVGLFDTDLLDGVGCEVGLVFGLVLVLEELAHAEDDLLLLLVELDDLERQFLALVEACLLYTSPSPRDRG